MQFGNRLVPGPAAWADKVHRAAPAGTTRWPRIAIWHDEGDTVVNPINARDSVAQWTAVHGIDLEPDLEQRVGAHRRQVFQDSDGRPLVELWTTRQVGHATAIDAAAGCGHEDPGNPNDFVTDAHLCATGLIARFWGLVP